MLKVISAQTMRDCDRAAIDDFGIEAALLMENAGLQVVDAMAEFFGARLPEPIAVVCGKGNNGGDGFVIARHLHNRGHDVGVFLAGARDAVSGVARSNMEIVERLGMEVVEIQPEGRDASFEALRSFGCIVDALLGTGIDRPVEGTMATIIAHLDGLNAARVAVDLPSGSFADRGELPPVALRADLTVALGAFKPCHVTGAAAEHCGEPVLADIGLPESVMRQAPAELWLASSADCAAALPVRALDSHKGNHGRVLIVAGAPGTAGAAVLAARGALRCGAGLVHLAVPESVYAVAATQLPEVMVHALPVSASGALGAAASAALAVLAARADVVAVGPGLSTDPETAELARQLIATLECPVVADADALNALVGHLESTGPAPGPRILTPHPGEAARLLDASTDAVQRDRHGALRRLVERSGAVVVLKGHRTLTGSPRTAPIVNLTGNPGMAAPGMGDVLTGMVAALSAQGLSPEAAAWTGAWLHGHAGDLALQGQVPASLTASDLIDAIGPAWAQLVSEETDVADA